MNNHFFFDGHKDNNNQRPLSFIVYLNGKMIKKRIGEKIEEKYFIQESQSVIKKYPDAERLNNKLKKIEEEYYNLLKINPEPTAEDIGNLIKSIKQGKKIEYKKIEDNTLVYWFERYKKEKTNSESAVEAYHYTAKSIQDFEEYKKYKITLEYIEYNNDEFRNQFVDFLKEDIIINGKLKKKNKAGSVVNKLEKINSVINWYNLINRKNINRLKVNNNKDNKADDKEVSNLHINELSIIYDLYINDRLDLKDSYINAVGNFLFRCFTGLRISESANIHSNQFTTDKLTYYSSKTKKKCEVPLFKQAIKIAERLNYKFYKFSSKQDKTIKSTFESRVIRSVVEKYINDREITEYNYDENKLYSFNLFEKISTHSARKTFGTFIYNHTGNIYVASKYLNHSSIEETIKYLGVNISNLADYVVDLSIGGEPVININNDNKEELPFTLLDLNKDINIELIYSNITLVYTGMFIDAGDIIFNKEYKLDDLYKIKGEVYNEYSTLIINIDCELWNDKKYIRTLKRGKYIIMKKGVN